jgi:DNA-binding NarL/FixJ family response regulator
MDGIELIRRVHPIYNGFCILVVTGHDIDIYKESALEAGADEIVSKGDFPRLITIVKKCIQK